MYSTPWEGPGEIYLARVAQNADSTSLVFCIHEKTSYVFGRLTHLFVPQPRTRGLFPHICGNGTLIAVALLCDNRT
jgi:hypothetical protein